MKYESKTAVIKHKSLFMSIDSINYGKRLCHFIVYNIPCKILAYFPVHTCMGTSYQILGFFSK